MLCNLNAILDFVVELWRDLLTLTARCQQSRVQRRTDPHNGLQILGCLSTRQFNLYSKSDSDQSEIQKRSYQTTRPSFACLSIPQTNAIEAIA